MTAEVAKAAAETPIKTPPAMCTSRNSGEGALMALSGAPMAMPARLNVKRPTASPP